MKILAIICLMMPLVLTAQKVGIHTTDPQHPFQVNVDSVYLNFSLDQQQNVAEDSFLMDIGQSILQTFVAGQTGHLAKCRIDMGEPVFDVVLLEVYRGAGPYGVQIANGELFDSSGTGILELIMPSPLPVVTEGETLHMILTSLNGSNTWRNSLGDSYPNGQAQFFDGATWSPLSYDMVFKTYLENLDTASVQSFSVQSDGRVRVKNYLLPAADGSEDQVITTDGNGSLIWANPASLGYYDEIKDADGDTRVSVEEEADEDAIRFHTAGSLKLLMNSLGNIGMGTSVPTGRLHLRHLSSPESPHLHLMEYVFDAYSRIKFSNQIFADIDWQIKAKVDDEASDSKFELFYKNGVWTGNKITVSGTGKVGIGNDDPAAKLDIKALGQNQSLLKLSTERPWVFKQTFTSDSSALSLQGSHDNIAFDITSLNGVNRAARFLVDTDSSTVSLVPDGGAVGIGTEFPAAMLHVNNGAVIFEAPEGDLPPVPDGPPASGSGTRMMWYPDKAAFRVGRVSGTTWDRDSIGSYSFAGGFSNMAKGIFSFVGSGEGGNYATGSHTFVGSGRDNIASGDYAFIGSGNDHNATATGSFIGGGAANSATGQYAAITGGAGNMASGDYSFSGSGLALFARSYGESAFGTYATDYVPMSTTSFHESDRLFVVGNGTSTSNRKDALTILKKGSIGVGTSSPEYRFHIEGSDTSSQHILSIQNNYSGNTHVRAIEAIANPANGYGIGGHFTGGSKGIEAIASLTGSVAGTFTGVDASVSGGSGGLRIGLLGEASGGLTNWAGYFGAGNVRVENDMHITGEIGLGVSPSSVKLKIAGNLTSTAHVLQVSPSYLGNSNIRAIDAASIPAPGYGYGGHFAGGAGGVVGLASSGNSTGTCVGIDGTATGTAGTRIGVRGSATGGTTNWAGYFSSGNVYITNELRIGAGAYDGATGYQAAIDGKLIAEEVRVQLSGDWPDYVFDAEYPLLSLPQVNRYIQENGHLPGIPSALEIEEQGHHLGEIQQKLLEKIEELTLHMIELHKQNEVLAQRIEELEKSNQ